MPSSIGRSPSWVRRSSCSGILWKGSTSFGLRWFAASELTLARPKAPHIARRALSAPAGSQIHRPTHIAMRPLRQKSSRIRGRATAVPQYGKAYRSSPELLAGTLFECEAQLKQADQLGHAGGTGCDSTRSRISSRQRKQKVSLFLAGLPLWVAAILLVVLPTIAAMCGPVLMRRQIGLERLASNNDIAGFKFATVG